MARSWLILSKSSRPKCIKINPEHPVTVWGCTWYLHSSSDGITWSGWDLILGVLFLILLPFFVWFSSAGKTTHQFSLTFLKSRHTRKREKTREPPKSKPNTTWDRRERERERERECVKFQTESSLSYIVVFFAVWSPWICIISKNPKGILGTEIIFGKLSSTMRKPKKKPNEFENENKYLRILSYLENEYILIFK